MHVLFLQVQRLSSSPARSLPSSVLPKHRVERGSVDVGRRPKGVRIPLV